MAFRKPGGRSDPEPRRTAVKIEYASNVRDALVDRIAAEVDKEDDRGRQKRIGPSEIGNPCDFCLGAKLAGLDQKPEFNWLAWIGTLVHIWLSKIFAITKSQYVVEERVSVGEIDGVEIKGSADLFDVEEACNVDWKIVGDRKLDKVRFSGDIGQEYRVQAHLYGRGHTHAGRKVRSVAVFFLPRNVWVRKPRELWSKGFWWAEPYDEQVAIDALARADRIARHIRLLGADMVLPTLERLDGCLDCKRWNYIEKEAA